MRKTTLVAALTGASGGIGQSLLPFLREVFEVKALFRSEGPAAQRARDLGCEVVAGSLENIRSLDELVSGADVVIHCAASVTRDMKYAHRTNVEGTRVLAERAASAGCRRFVLLSSVAVYLGNAGVDGVFPEDVPLRLNDRMDHYSRTKLLGEETLREVAVRRSMEHVVLRPTCVYGPGVDAWTVIPFKTIAGGVPILFGDGKGEMDVIEVSDVARGIVLAAASPHAAGETLNLGGNSAPASDFMSYYARMANRRLKRIPLTAVNAISTVGNFAQRVLPIPAAVEPKQLNLIQFCMDGKPGVAKFPSTKIRERLGFEPTVPLHEGMQRCHLWLESQGFTKRRRTFRHCDDNYRFSPPLTLYPESESDLLRVVRHALKSGRRVRVIGSIHSMAPLPSAPDLCVSLERFRRFVSISGDSVTVEAGMRVHELNTHLAAYGLALPTLGAITEQTISGAVSTGTHGGSIHQASLANAVDSVRVITGEGEVAQLDRSDDRFFGAVLAMGLCGIMSEVTLRCVPAFCLQSENHVLPLTVAMQRFDEFNREYDFSEMLWFPMVDQVEVMTTRRLKETVENRELKPVKSAAPRLPTSLIRLALQAFHAGRMQGLCRRIVSGWPGWWYPSREGRSDYVLGYMPPEPTRIPTADMEMAVPVEHVHDVIAALRSYYKEAQWLPTIGVRLRCQKKESFWLSGSFDRDICWFELYHTEPAGDFPRHMHDLFARYAFRPHWGKNLHPAADYWPGVYPQWERFQKLRRAMDPSGLFENEYTRSIGLAVTTPPYRESRARPRDQRT